MPFRDKTRQREVQREGARRRRAAKRLAAEGAVEEVVVDGVAPIVVEVAPDDAPIVSAADLALAGSVLRHARSPQESTEEYRARLRLAWQTMLRVVS